MIPELPHACGPLLGSAVIRSCPEDFQVREELGFDLSGSGEHVFLYLEKRQLNTLELQGRLSQLSSVALKDIGLSGLKDRNAVTSQWFSIGLAGAAEPDWQALEKAGDVKVLRVGRHLRKLRRGVHQANRFTLVLRQLTADRPALESRLIDLREQGAPNYFGEQRFGRNGSTLEQAQRAMRGRRKLSRVKRGLYFSALRAHLFNQLLAARVEAGDWNQVSSGDVCMLHGSRSFFTCEELDEELVSRCLRGDIHPGLPLWGKGESSAGPERHAQQLACLAESTPILAFLEESGLEMAWRPARLLPDDFCWQFCDDGSLQLDFALGAGSYATALLSELAKCSSTPKRK